MQDFTKAPLNIITIYFFDVAPEGEKIFASRAEKAPQVT